MSRSEIFPSLYIHLRVTVPRKPRDNKQIPYGALRLTCAVFVHELQGLSLPLFQRGAIVESNASSSSTGH